MAILMTATAPRSAAATKHIAQNNVANHSAPQAPAWGVFFWANADDFISVERAAPWRPPIGLGVGGAP